MRYIASSDIVKLFNNYTGSRDEMEETYKKVCTIEDNKLGLEDLLFKKLYGCYEKYKSLDTCEIIDIYDGVIFCDKDAEEYKVDVSRLFEDMIKTISSYKSHELPEFFPVIQELCDTEENKIFIFANNNFMTFPDIDIEAYLKENTTEVRESLSQVISEACISAIRLENICTHITAEYTPNCLLDYINQQIGCWWDEAGIEIYHLFDKDSFMKYHKKKYRNSNFDNLTYLTKIVRLSEYLIKSKEIDKFIGEFIKIRNQCFKAYYILSRVKNNAIEGSGLSESEIEYYSDYYDRTLLLIGDLTKEYKNLSIADFNMDNNYNLHIINNADIYEMLGVNIEKYVENSKQEEFER